MDRMMLTIDIEANNIGPRKVNVRSSLVVANLIATVKDKYNLDGNFEVRLSNSRRPLPPEAELDQAGVADGSTLVCSRIIEASGTAEAILRGVRERLSKKFKRVYLQEARQLNEFDLAWQPAVIGRRDRRDPSQNRLLAVDLDDVEDSTTVSRHHACITEKDGSFFVEGINENNPTYLGDSRLRTGVKTPLPVGSKIRVGRVTLTFYIVS